MNRNEGKFFLLGFFLLSTGFRSAFSREQRQKLKSTKNDEEAARPMMNRWRAVTARPPARPPGRHYRAAPSVIKSRHPIGRRRHSRRHVTPPSSDALLLFLFFFPFCSSFDFVSLVSVGSRVVAESHFWVFFFFVTEFLCSIVLDFFGRYSIRVVNAKPQPAIGASSLSPDDYRVFLLFFGVFFFLVLVLPWVSFFQGAHSDRDTGSSQSGRFQVSFLS